MRRAFVEAEHLARLARVADVVIHANGMRGKYIDSYFDFDEHFTIETTDEQGMYQVIGIDVYDHEYMMMDYPLFLPILVEYDGDPDQMNEIRMIPCDW